jgi:hypothetical protein
MPLDGPMRKSAKGRTAKDWMLGACELKSAPHYKGKRYGHQQYDGRHNPISHGAHSRGNRHRRAISPGNTAAGA